MNNWYLYIIKCKNNSLYTGITTDVKKRFKDHQDGKGAKYLRGKAPLELVFKKKVGEKSLALKIEIAIKKLTKDKKEMIINKELKIKDIKNGLNYMVVQKVIARSETKKQSRA